ncbi:MAG: signal peptidase I [Butyribacter sp.]|nr:signal peptidase I [bacterium]MDY3853428.1 signal peptidase I [Butyribacter sp.]
MRDINTEEEEQAEQVTESSAEENLDLDKEEKAENKWSAIVKELLVYAIIIVVCVMVVPRYVIQRTEVDGGSMMNTLQNEENLLVEKCVWRVTGLKRYDIVTFYPEGRDTIDPKTGEPKYYIKRIIGLPGETVQVVGDVVYINGKVLDDKKYKEEYDMSDGFGDGGIAEEPITLKDDEYFVMGDHRGISEDSRSSAVGPVKRENIDGRVALRIYPFSEFGTVE